MSNRVVKSPVIVDKKGKPNYPEIERIPSEKWLQDFLPLCPDVLPVADIDSNYADLTYVCNEASIKTSKKGTGFDAYAMEWKDMMEAGIIDPAKVTRTALQNAASIASLLLTTECAITDIPEKNPAPAMPAGDMGGMGGMY